ncbi:MAG TPA: phosphoribosylglycinamide formyltransferase [Gemmataceae bacterium]|jgi:phosphoribosylglycinamide formyltransferase-1|nr:phosphoribosylglycinamide formyltransferase [Gemmataceae bacterium]
MSSPLRIAVLVSGGGTTLQNFVDQIADRQLAAQIVQVIGSRADAFGVERARRARLPVAVVNAKEVGREEFSARIFDFCRRAQAELVCLAGFLHYLRIPADFALRVMNIHPALLPAFGGKGMYGHHVHEAVLEHGVKITGCTVHFADHEYDHGPIILQRAIPVLDDDTPETLAFRIFEQECIAYPEAIRLFAEKKLKVEGRRVRLVGNAEQKETKETKD